MSIRNILTVISSLACVWWLPAVNAAWTVDPSVEMRGTYDSNVALTEEPGDKDASSAEIVAQAKVRSVTERGEVTGIVGGNFITYSGYDGTFRLDESFDQFGALRANRKFENATLGFDGYVRHDDLFRRIRVVPDAVGPGSTDIDLSQPAAGGDLEVADPNDLDQGTVTGQVKRLSLDLSPYYRLQMGPRTSASFEYRYSSRNHDESDSSQVEDSTSHSAGISLRRQTSLRDALQLSVGASRFDPEDNEDSDSYSLTAAWDRQVSERNRVSLEVGARRTERDGGDDSTGLLVTVQANRQLLTGNLRAEYQRSTSPNSSGDLNEVDRVSISLRRALNDRWNLDVFARGFTYDPVSSTDEAVDRSQDFIEAGTLVSWAFTRSLSIGAEYGYRWVDRNDEPTSSDGHAVSLSIKYQPPSRF